MSRPVPNPGILDIAPYTPGKTPVPEPGRKVFKLSANETPFGPSPKAIEAFTHVATHLEDYPEGTSRVLREAIGRTYGLDPDRIICGAGSDEILNLLAHTYLSQGDEAISTTHGFLVYPIATMANGARNVVAPETEYTANVDAILKLVTPRTKLVWLANPNNPTGTYIPFDEVKRLRAGLPGHVLLVLDAAYADYVSRNDYELGIELVATTENTVVTHTFSKIHGLAALRILEKDRKSTRLNSSHLGISYAHFHLLRTPSPTRRSSDLSTRSSGCAPACLATCCWCWMRPMPTTSRATTMSSALSWWRPPRTRW